MDTPATLFCLGLLIGAYAGLWLTARRRTPAR